MCPNSDRRRYGLARLFDIEAFFDFVDHALCVKGVARQVREGALLRLSGNWLKAGVMD